MWYDTFHLSDDPQTTYDVISAAITGSPEYWLSVGVGDPDAVKKTAVLTALLDAYNAGGEDGGISLGEHSGSLAVAVASILSHVGAAGPPPQRTSAAIARFLLTGSFGGSGYPTTPAGFEIPKHTAARIRYGAPGRPPVPSLAMIDTIIGYGTQTNQPGSIKFTLGRNYVVVSTINPGRIVTVTIPKPLLVGIPDR